MNEDALLLRRYAEERSESAFAELVRRHLDLVYSAALRRTGGDPHRAADAVQQVFTRLARDARRLASHTVLTAWLYTATRNAAIDLLRAETRRRAREQEAHVMHDLISEPVRDVEWEKLRPVLDGVVDELGETDRAVVLLRFFDRRSFAEVGAALNVSTDAARMRTERALDKLHALLAKRGITSTSAALGVVLSTETVAAAPVGLAASVTGAALSSAVGGASSLFGLLQFMSTTQWVASAAVIIALLAVGTAGYKVHNRQEAEASLIAVQAFPPNA
ncbi:MAG: sigma-70 family RNA polymerase sigma factor [Opitutaceae bacterium]|nr:sigma-70 family RNA polymerase sigma factor [Opitutaceae bacterium]